jgi:small GTP-binding protein
MTTHMENIKVCAVGDGAVGKTSALISYTTNSFPQEYEPTVFENYSCALMVDGKPISLQLWDTAGQEDYDKLRPLSYPQTDGFLLCFSISSPNSFANIKSKWYPELVHYCGTNVPIVLVGLKSDLRTDRATIRHLQGLGKDLVSQQEAEALAEELGMEYREMSALTQEGMMNTFNTVVRSSLEGQKKKKPKKKFLRRMWSKLFGR